VFKRTGEFKKFSPMLATANEERQNYKSVQRGKIKDTCMCCIHAHIGRLESAWYTATQERWNFCRVGGFRLHRGNYATCDKHKHKRKPKIMVTPSATTATSNF